jgi:hypothetical protein
VEPSIDVLGVPRRVVIVERGKYREVFGTEGQDIITARACSVGPTAIGV